MSRLLKPSAESPLKLLALNSIGDRYVSLPFPAVILQPILPGTAVPLEHLMERPPDPFVDTGGWLHGGINE